MCTAALVGASVAEIGPIDTGGVLGGVALAGVALYRGAPGVWDKTIGPHAGVWRRRWFRYSRRWARLTNGCGLTVLDRRSGEVLVPRLRRVRARGYWDVLVVRMLPGQKFADWEEAAEALAAGLLVDRVAVEKISPNEVALLLERDDPFGPLSDLVPASEIPEWACAVDLSSVDVGATEDGNEFCVSLLGTHVLVTGVTRAGKAGLIWNPLRALGPAIREGLVLVHAADLKGGAEMDPGVSLFRSYARTAEGCLAMLRHLVSLMEDRQAQIRVAARRKFLLSADEPFHLVLLDELLVMTEYCDRSSMLEFRKLLGKLLTQGAALGFCVMAYAQDPTTDGVPMRKLFPTKIALRLDSDTHVDMVLGDGARLLGALADKIAADQQGVGYVKLDHKREPIRFRLGATSDEDIAELVERCTPEGNVPVIFDPPADAAPVRAA